MHQFKVAWFCISFLLTPKGIYPKKIEINNLNFYTNIKDKKFHDQKINKYESNTMKILMFTTKLNLRILQCIQLRDVTTFIWTWHIWICENILVTTFQHTECKNILVTHNSKRGTKADFWELLCLMFQLSSIELCNMCSNTSNA